VLLINYFPVQSLPCVVANLAIGNGQPNSSPEGIKTITAPAVLHGCNTAIGLFKPAGKNNRN
jgi:hypothetical protein